MLEDLGPIWCKPQSAAVLKWSDHFLCVLLRFLPPLAICDKGLFIPLLLGSLKNELLFQIFKNQYIITNQDKCQVRKEEVTVREYNGDLI